MDILYQHWIMWWFLSSNASNAPRYLGWGYATKHHATQNSSSLPLVFPCFFWGETLVQRLTDMVLLSLSLRFTLDLPTKWTHVKVVLPLRHGHVQRALGMMQEWNTSRESGDWGGVQLSISFGLREMSSNWKSTWGHTNTAISINIPAFSILEIETGLWITMLSAVILGPRKLFLFDQVARASIVMRIPSEDRMFLRYS